jgi:hypothetical protein
MNIDVYIARGSEANIHRSIVNGIEKSLVEDELGITVPNESVDSFGRVHLWGVPMGRAEKYWKSMKKGDIIIILPVRKGGGKVSECYITMVVDKYPVNMTQEDIKKCENFSRIIWESYRRRQGRVEAYPYIVFIDSRISVENLDDVLKILGKDMKSLEGYRESVKRVRGVTEQALQELIQRITQVPDTSTILTLLEEVYLELSVKLGWNPVNCYYYSIKYNVCYGAPVPLGNKKVWNREGLFEELNRKLIEKRYRPITWDHLKELIRSITKPGVIWASWFSSPYTKQVEPHDVTIMKPSFSKE